MWSVGFELGSWCLAALAMTLAPRTHRRWTLLAVSCAAALVAGMAVRLVHAPSWTPGKVDPAALAAAALVAILVALAFEIGGRHHRRLRNTSAT